MTRFARRAALLLAAMLVTAVHAAGVPPAWRSGSNAPPVPRKPAARVVAPAELARQAREAEDVHDYGLAVLCMRELRRHVKPDADLELALALDEARVGLADSAWARLDTRLMRAAAADSSDISRRHDYDFRREPLWLNGRFDGWYWYVARARAELALARGLIPEAVASARVAAAARPLSPGDHLLLAVVAGRAGDDALARRELARALTLSPVLPEAQYLRGVRAWRDGDRATAREAFEAALARDSSDRLAGLAQVRLRLPGTRPDSLPARFLTGARAVDMLTSPEGPKLEENPQNDQPAGIFGQPELKLPDSLQAVMKLAKPLHYFVTVLVDERGKVQLVNLPWLADGAMPDALIGIVHAAAADWKFRPAVKVGRPVRSWASVEYILNP